MRLRDLLESSTRWRVWSLEGPSDAQTELELFSDEEGGNHPQDPPSSSEAIEESISSTNPNEVFNFKKLTDKEESPSFNNSSKVEIPD